MEDLRLDRRDAKRFYRELMGQYFFYDQKTGFKKCTITDISIKGAGIKFHSPEKLTVGAKICLEVYLPLQLEPLNVTGVLKRFEQRGDDLIGGIQFLKPLHKDQLSALL